MLHVEPRPLEVWGHVLPGNLHALRVLLVASGAPKLAVNKLLGKRGEPPLGNPEQYLKILQD